MDERATRRPARTPRRGYDIHQTHFFYRDDLEAGATVVDHVTGEAVGQVDHVGRHVFEGYGAPAVGGGEPGDLVVEVVELDVEPASPPPPARPARPVIPVEPVRPVRTVDPVSPVVPVRMPWRAPGAVRREDADRQGEDTVTVDVDTDGGQHVDEPKDEPADVEPEEALEPTARLDAPDDSGHQPAATDVPDTPEEPEEHSARPAFGASLAQGLAIAVLGPVVALLLLIVLLVVLFG